MQYVSRLPFSSGFLIWVLICTGALTAQAQQTFFEPVSLAQARMATTGKSIPNSTFYQLKLTELRTYLAQAPLQDQPAKAALRLEIPLPNGTVETFALRQTQVLSPALAAEHPTFKTYSGQGETHPDYVIRLSLTSLGLDAIIWGVAGDAVYVNKVSTDPANALYRAYFARDARQAAPAKGAATILRCGSVGATDKPALPGLKVDDKGLRIAADQVSAGASVRVFRIAIATTGEWTRNAGGFPGITDPVQLRTNALAVVVTAVNRVNGIYERELACRFTLVNPSVSSGGNILFDDPTTDPYDNTDAEAQLTINQTTIDSRVGTANYDVGHLFGTGGGGVALSPSLCSPGKKAEGYSARDNQTGDTFVVDYFAHELGHQFGMSHTYNQSDPVGGACTTREPTRAYEVASGSTIMSYVGICNEGRNLQEFNDFGLPAFHVTSLVQANNYLLTGSDTPGCGTTTGSNTIPTVSAGASYVIPRLTPFTLTATGADADASDAQNLLYSWEEYDLAPSASGDRGTPPGTYDIDDDGVLRPLLRAYSPMSATQRTFPSMAFILNPQNNATPGENQPALTYRGTHPTGFSGATCPTGTTCVIGERLPTISRTMTFRVSVRDRRGGVADASTTVQVVNTPGAFRLTAFDNTSSVAGNSSQPVTWNVVNTNQAPVNCANVAILLSTDGGQTFPTTLLASTANDGSEAVILPNITTSQARLKIAAVGNIFFDISNANFTITAVSAGLALTTQANPTAVCAGGTVALSVSATGGTSPYSYTWTAPAGVILSATSTSAVSATVSTAGVQTFSVTVAGSGGSPVSTGTVSVTVNPIPTVTISANPSLTATQSQSVTLTASGAATYQWSNSANTASIVVAAAQAGPYSVTGTSSAGCSAIATATVSTPVAGTVSASFAITGVTTVSCQTITTGLRRVSFTPQYAGTSGQPISFSVTNELVPTTNPGPYTLNLYTDNPTVILKASQSSPAGQVSFTYNWLASCSGSVTPPPPTPGSSFSITGVTLVSCQTVMTGLRRISFTPQYAGLTGQPISFSVANELLPTTAAGPYMLNLYTDNPAITLKASQSGTAGEASFRYSWLAACSGNARLGSEPLSESVLSIRLLSNPAQNGQVSFEVRGAAGEPLQMSLTDVRGRMIGVHSIGQAGSLEQHTFEISRQPVGLFLLRAATATQSQTVRVIKVE